MSRRRKHTQPLNHPRPPPDMKTVLPPDRASAQFWEIMGDFADSLRETFPKCGQTGDWHLFVKNVVIPDDEKRANGIEKWKTGMEQPLKKGAARYAKAVQSITGSPCTIYHAIAYKDVDAVHASHETLSELDLATKFHSDAMDAEAKSVFWDYLSNLNRLAYAAASATPPRVPNPDEIAADIARRRGGGTATSDVNASSAPPEVLKQGIRDVWTRLCELRGVKSGGDDTKQLVAKITTAFREEGVADQCRKHSPEGFNRLVKQLPELGTKEPTEEQWTVIDKLAGLISIDSSFSAPVMQNIESVASQLVADLSNGTTDFASLDVEAIGKRVLENVPQSEVADLAKNIDKLMPAIGALQEK